MPAINPGANHEQSNRCCCNRVRRQDVLHGKEGSDYVSHRIEDAFDALRVEDAHRKLSNLTNKGLGPLLEQCGSATNSVTVYAAVVGRHRRLHCRQSNP